ncbi:type VI secretion system contractile sheath large subunit [Ignavibacteria bacterium]|nr:type VI secretion system contractile sheath large subunit [Bacteroidota bacterium]MCZ2133444.1 type VI secretion system contractile sheath large subunit [Bacteroidota bacterium]
MPQQSSNSLSTLETLQEAAGHGNLLDMIVTEGKMARGAEQMQGAKDMLSEFISQVVGQTAISKDAVSFINTRIAQIDTLLSDQINEILHNGEFQKLEATWRGMKQLVYNTETGQGMKVRVLNASKKELLNDLERASEFDQSALFKQVYEAEFGQFGGAPYTFLVADYEFGRGPQDITLLEKLSNVAAAAHAPVLTAASPLMFDMDSYQDLNQPRDLAKIFESAEMAKWRSFRESEDSQYVVLTLPHTLMRLPYGPNTVPVDGFNFKEDVDGKDHSKYLWGNAAWSLAQRVTNACAVYGWPAAIRGVEGGGIVEGLPTHTFLTDDGDNMMKVPTEVAIPDRREKELDDLGFLPLVHCKGTDYAAFFGSATSKKPKLYDNDAANANSRISAQLPYVMVTSRFAHYLKAIMRDKIGSFASASNVSSFLNNWIMQYTMGLDDAGQEVKASYPLRDARVDVFEVPGKPGSYKASVFLRPHFQLNELTASMRLVAELPPPKG